MNDGDEYIGDYNKTRERWEPEIDGDRHTLMEWSRISGVSHNLIIDRRKRGWIWERAIFTRARKYRNNRDREVAA